MGRSEDRYCHGAQTCTGLERKEYDISKRPNPTIGLSFLLLCTWINASFVPHRMLLLFANKMLEWSEGAIGISSLLWGSNYLV